MSAGAPPRDPAPATVLFGVESMERAGAEQVVVSLASRIDRSRFRPIVCCLTDRGELAAEIERRDVPVFALHKHPHFDLPVVPRLFSLLRRERVDLVHSHVWPANVWCRVVGRAAGLRGIVVTEHNVDLWKKKRHFAIDRALARVTDRIVCVSEAVRRFYASEAGIDPAKLLAIPNGIDGAPFGAANGGVKKRRELGLAAEERIAIVVARLLPQKDHRNFLEAMKRVAAAEPRARGMVVGEGPLRAALERSAEELGLAGRILFLGERRDVPELLAASDAVVLSSVHEGMPLAALEGMAAGKPLVVTDVGGNREVVEDGVTGYVVPPRDPAALARAIGRVLGAREEARAMGARGRERMARHFTVERMVRRHEELYTEILASRSSYRR